MVKIVGRLWKGLGSVPTRICAIFLLLILFMAAFAPWLAGLTQNDPYSFNVDLIDSMTGGLPLGGQGGISADHWFGVEPQTGRDIFSRVVYGARTSLIISFFAVVVSVVAGVTLGTAAGYFGGKVDQIISRLMDFMMSFPTLIFMIALISALPQIDRYLTLIGVMSLFGWTQIGRVVRAQTMSLKSNEYVEAALAAGARPFQVMLREIVPNLSGTILVMGAIAMPTYIGIEASLSFLGVGVVPPTPSWGQMIASAVPWYTVLPTYFLIPGFFLLLTVLSLIVLGDHLDRTLKGRVK